MAKNTEPVSAPEGIRRVERVLAYAAVSVAVLSAVCIVIGLLGHPTNRAEAAQGIWPTIFFLPAIGLPAAFLMIVAFMIVSTRRRRREENAVDQRGTTR